MRRLLAVVFASTLAALAAAFAMSQGYGLNVEWQWRIEVTGDAGQTSLGAWQGAVEWSGADDGR